MLTQNAAVPCWNLAESLIIPATTSDKDWWMATTPGGEDASTNAAVSGEGGFWSVQGIQVNVDTDSTAGIVIGIISVAANKTDALETIQHLFYAKGTYVVPVLWRAKDANKYLKVDLNGDGTAGVYVRAFGVKILK